MREHSREVLQIVIKTVKFDFTGDQVFVFSTLVANISYFLVFWLSD